MKDVATLIWELAKADKTYDGLALKEMFRKKVDNDSRDLRLQLKELVARQIKAEKQPYKAELLLTTSTKDPNYIFGGVASVRPSPGGTGKPINQPHRYFYHHLGQDWYEVTNYESQMLIDAAIALDLKWRISSPAFANNIVVSWRHWHCVEETTEVK